MRADPVVLVLALAVAWVVLKIWWRVRCALYRKQPIPTWMWMEVMERGRWRCANRWCRSTLELQADHKWPEWWFGRTVPSNLQPLCKRCNMRKGTRIKLPLVPWWLWWLWRGLFTYRRR